MAAQSTFPSANNSYNPVTPFTATVSSSMSQDVLTTAEIPVDSTSPNPVGVFVNPAAAGIANNRQAEALAVVSISQNGSSSNQLCHIARNYSTDAGWQSVPLFGGRTATEVAAGTAYASSGSAAVCGFFADANGVYSTGLQSGNWSHPATVATATASNLQVAYSPLGALILYGSTPTGDLMTAFQQTVGGPFTSVICKMNGALAGNSFQLTMTDESHWTLAVNAGGAPVLYLGVLGATEFSAQQTASGFQGTLRKVVLSYWSNTQNTLMFLFVDSDDALHVWATNSATSTTVSQQIPNSSVASASGFVDLSGNLHVYSLDTNLGMWVLHQDPNTPWNQDGTPNWSPYIPIDSGIGGVATDMNPADSPTLFALDASTYSLRLHAQDPLTQLWATGNVLQSSDQAYEVVRFRTEVALVDANGVAVPYYPVSLTVAPGYSACEIWSAGSVTAVNSQTEVSLSTDATGRLTFAVLTTAGMVTPAMILNASGLPAPVTIQPSEPVHIYLSGTGILNPTNPSGPIPVFDPKGSTLASAKTSTGTTVAPGASNAQLAGVAAQAIQSTALAGMGNTPQGVTGYQINISGSGGPSFQVLTSTAELETARATLFARPEAGAPGSIWGDIASWFGDLWQGIKNGVTKMVSALVDVVNKAVNFVVQIGDDIAKGIQVALKGLEEAAHFIAGVFQAVEADIEKVIDWLKALFDFGAIWRTKMAFEQVLDQAPNYISNVLGFAQKATDGWFAKQENTVNQAFDRLKAKYSGQSFSSLPNWQTQGKPPSSTPVVGNAAPSDFTTNVHHNWVQDKVNAYAPSSAGNTTSSNLQNAFQAFITNVGEGADDFINALTSFKDAIASIIQHPTSFQTVAIPDFISMVQNLVESLLHFCDAIVDLLVTLADVAMLALQEVLTANLDIPILSTLWSWIATAAGYPEDSELTISSLLALVAAFPTTVAYKLVAGTSEEPFPNGQFPGGNTLTAGVAGAAPFGSMPPGCVLASAILQIIYVIPAAIGDGLGAQCPKWLSIGTIVFSVLIWALGNGLPDLSTIEWISAAVVAANLLWIAPTVYFVVQTAFTQFFDKVSDNFNDILVVLVSLYGFGKFVLGAVLDFLTEQDEYQAIAKLLLPQGPQYAFLQLSALREDPLAPLFIALNVVMDGVAYIGGGVLLTIDAAKNLDNTSLSGAAIA